MKIKKWTSLYVLVIFFISACAPTTTPVPVLPTPASPSPIPPTFLSPPIISTATSITSMMDCNQSPAIQPKGSLVNVEFENQSGSVILSFGMNEPNDKNECVTYSYTIPEADVISTQVLAGCYWGYGWVDGSDSAKTDSLLCLWDENTIYHILIVKGTIVLQ